MSRYFKFTILVCASIFLLAGCKKDFNYSSHINSILYAPTKIYTDEEIKSIVSYTHLEESKQQLLENALQSIYMGDYNLTIERQVYSQYDTITDFIVCCDLDKDDLHYKVYAYFTYNDSFLTDYDIYEVLDRT